MTKESGTIRLGHLEHTICFTSRWQGSAGLDRLSHRAQMIVITGSSFRAREAQDPGKEVPTESTP